MNSNAGSAGTAQLPARGVKLGGLREVRRLQDLDAVSEGEALGLGTREAEPHLASGLQVVVVVVERPRIACRHQLSDRRELAFTHCRLHVRPGGPVRGAFAAPQLSQQDIAVAAKLG